MDASLFDLNLPLATVTLALGIGGSVGVLGAALALGLRHGIDWDHIAAITDITSTTASAHEPEENWLTGEIGVMLTDESHHSLSGAAQGSATAAVAVGATAGRRPIPVTDVHSRSGNGQRPWALSGLPVEQRRALYLGTMYALGHGSIVTVLGLLAILGSDFLPASIDPIMERIVGVTLILLAAYLFYSVYRFFRAGGEFRIRSRWMLVFAGVRNAFHWLLARVDSHHRHHRHHHVRSAEQYGVKTAYGVGLIHGIGAETGTQVLVIATAVGAGTKAMGIAAMMAFVLGLIISNSVVTVATTAGFISSRRRQSIYVLAGLLAAVFSLAVGLVFLFQAGDILPDLGRYFRWLGGPET